jgi:hypothetical protein
MKKSPWSLLLLFTLVVAVWWWGRPEPQSQPEPPPAVSSPLGKSTAPGKKAAVSDEPLVLTSPTQLASASVQSTEPIKFTRIEAPPPPPIKIPGGYAAGQQPDPAAQEAEEISLNIRNFSLRFGGNPVGNNAEITKALNGGNDAGAGYLPAARRISGGGELLDTWGTPYFFHANSATELEVRSAGPDKKLYTSDDLTAH